MISVEHHEDCQFAFLEPNSVISDRYVVVNYIGAGATGWVVSARDQKLTDKKVALKILYPHLLTSQDSRKRFANELLLTRKLSHKNIVQTYDYGTTDEGLFFFSMELVEGESFSQKLSILDLQESQETTLKWLFEIAAAMAFAHTKGVVHRDIKPDNILIANDGTPKILDFGIADILQKSDESERSTKVSGTPYYMSPEQFAGVASDERTDIYSFGILAYQAVVGELPFKGPTLFALAQAHLAQKLPSIASHDIWIAPWLYQLIEACTKKNKVDRIQSFQEVTQLIAQNRPLFSDCSELESRPLVFDYKSDEELAESIKANEHSIMRWGRRFLSTFIITILILQSVSSLTDLSNVAIISSVLLIPFCLPIRIFTLMIIMPVVLATMGVLIFRVNPSMNKRISASIYFYERTTGLNFKTIKNIFKVPYSGKSKYDLLLLPIEEKSMEHQLWAMLHSGLNIEQRGPVGQTILHRACAARTHKAVGRLIAEGANLNSRDKYFRTPLHYAAKHDCDICVYYLTHYGADLSAVDTYGEDALIVALSNSSSKSATVILSRIDKTSATEASTGNSALHLAVFRESLALVRNTAKKVNQIDARNILGQSPLHLAIIGNPNARNYSAIIRELLSLGANPNLRDENGKSPLDYAKELNRKQAFETMRQNAKVL